MAAGQKALCLLPTSVARVLESRHESKGLRPSTTSPGHRKLSQGSYHGHFFYFSYFLLLSDF